MKSKLLAFIFVAVFATVIVFAATEPAATITVDELKHRRDINLLLAAVFRPSGPEHVVFYFQGKADAYSELAALLTPPVPPAPAAFREQQP